MNRPFFTIIIPTKNRPKYLLETVKSVLLQDYTDFECIVSDNHNDVEISKVLNQVINNPKLQIIIPPREMNMIDHWEFASKQAKGRYVLILADRKLLVQGALKISYKIIKENPTINCFSVRTQVFDDLKNAMGWVVPKSKSGRLETKSLIYSFLNTNHYTNGLDHKYPKSLNSFYKNDYVNKIRKISGSYFNNTNVTTPDYSSFFINMLFNKEVFHINNILILTQGEHTSNGRLFGGGAVEKYMKSLGIVDPYLLVPIKAPLIFNLLVSDFLTIKAIYNKTHQDLNLNLDNYFYTNCYEYIMKTKDNNNNEFAMKLKKEICIAIKSKSVKKCDEYFDQVDKEFILLKNKKLSLKNKITGFLTFRFSQYKVVNYFLQHKFPNALKAGKF